MRQLKKLRMIIGRGQFCLAQQTGIERSRLSLLENGHIQANEKAKATIEEALSTVMRENVAQFNRLSGTDANNTQASR